MVRKCTCCGQSYVRREFDKSIHDILEFCITCRDNRCDAYPGTCPNRSK